MKAKIFKTQNINNVKITEMPGGITDGEVSGESNTGTIDFLELEDSKNSEGCDSKLNELPHAASKPDQGNSKKLTRYFLSNSKVFSISMSVVLFLAGSLWLSKKNTDKELLLRKYTSQAELSEFDFRFVAASDQWHQAIKIAEGMSDKRKVLGDLHLRAATAEWQVIMNEKYLITEKLHQDKNISRRIYQSIIDADIKPYADAELADLRTALAIYQKIPNTKADQVAIIDKLKPILENDVTEFKQMLPHSPYIRYALNTETSTKAESAKYQAIQDMLAKKPGLGLQSFKDYIRETGNSHDLVVPVVNFAHSLRPDEKSIYSDLVPILFEVVYGYDGGPRDLLAASYCLDYSLTATGQNANNTFESRLKNGDSNFDARNYHAALLEYYRCLGFKFDQVVHEKLLKTLQLCREQDRDTPNPPNEYITLLTKSKALNLAAYGLENLRTQDDISRLGLAYAVLDRFDDAERELLLGEPLHMLKMQPNAFNLADIYARDGKPDQAIQWYQRGKALEEKADQSTTSGVWSRMAFVCIRSGRWKEAAKYTELEEAEPRGDSFGSNSLGTIHQPMME